MRDNLWLKNRLLFFLQNYFQDVKGKNNLVIFFGRKARTRLGSIQYKPKTRETIIRITALFKDEKIPQYVVDGTIIHELIHYAHGFSSPQKQCFRYPHQGGVIRKEMGKRDLDVYYLKSKVWLKQNWANYIKQKIKYKKPKTNIKNVKNLSLSRLFDLFFCFLFLFLIFDI